MKLKNKKTGAIYSIEDIDLGNNVDGIWLGMTCYKSLAELNEEWEDYEESKDFWFVDPEILIACESTDPLLCDKKVAIETMKQIGNYFSSREEAEQAVEKLKAWRRLKDKGFKFCCDIKYESLCGNGFNIPLNAIMPPEAYTDTEVSKDLDLLFRGEE